MTTDRDEEGRGQGHSFTHTKKVRVSKLNTYKTFAYAVINTAQYCNMAKRQYVKIWDFTSVSAFENKTFLSLHPTPLILSFLLAISFSYSDNTIKATQYRYVRQYSTVSNCKGNNIIFNMRVFCDEEETDTFEVPNEWSERKSHNNTSVCTITMFLQSDKCNIQLSLCTSWRHMGERRYSWKHY